MAQGFLTPDEWTAVWLSLGVAARSVALGLPLAVLLGWALARGRFMGKWALDALVHLPMVLPPVVVGWLLLLVLGVRGPVGSWLNQWFGIRLVFTAEGAAIACAAMSLPLMVRAVRLSIEAIDPGLEQAARTLGAGRLDRFLTITLPMALPGVISAAIVGYVASLGEFGAVITFAANIPGQTQTLPLAIYSALQTPDGEAVAARLALVSILLAVVGLAAAEWAGRRGRATLGQRG
jgi:molybdate transport system permease protein